MEISQGGEVKVKEAIPDFLPNVENVSSAGGNCATRDFGKEIWLRSVIVWVAKRVPPISIEMGEHVWRNRPRTKQIVGYESQRS